MLFSTLVVERALILNADIFLEITMILGKKYGERRSIRSEDFFFFFFLLEIIMVLGGKYGKWRSIRSEDLFLEIIMIFGEKLQSAPNFKYPPLIGVAQNFIFQNGVA